MGGRLTVVWREQPHDRWRILLNKISWLEDEIRHSEIRLAGMDSMMYSETMLTNQRNIVERHYQSLKERKDLYEDEFKKLDEGTIND